MTDSRVAHIAERVKAIAIGFIGALFFVLGMTYFDDRPYYQVPRLLLPVFNLFGNIGLAVGLLLLGATLMYWGFRKFTTYQGQSVIMLTLLPVFLISGYSIVKLAEKTYQPDLELKKDANKQNQDIPEDVKNAIRPSLDNVAANAYLDKIENLVQEMEKAKEENNKARLNELEKQHAAIGDELNTFLPEIAQVEGYRDFALYNAKIMIKIKELRE